MEEIQVIYNFDRKPSQEYTFNSLAQAIEMVKKDIKFFERNNRKFEIIIKGEDLNFSYGN